MYECRKRIEHDAQEVSAEQYHDKHEHAENARKKSREYSCHFIDRESKRTRRKSERQQSQV